MRVDKEYEELFAIYCEHYAREDSYRLQSNNDLQNLLPMNLHILRKINLDGKTVILTDSVDNTEDIIFNLDISHENLCGWSYIDETEHAIVEIIITDINKKLETADTLFIIV